jgi:hypothetical protein
MIGETISHYQILEKLGEARFHKLVNKIFDDDQYQITLFKINKHCYAGQGGPVRRSPNTLNE